MFVNLCLWLRYDGLHRLLLQSGPHRHLPVQAAVALHQEAPHPDGHGRPLPAHHAAAPGDDPAGETPSPAGPLQFGPRLLNVSGSSADALHSSEHHHLRGLQEPVVDVPASARPHPAQREGKLDLGHSADRQRVSLSDCRVPLLQYFADLRNSIVNSQPPEKQQAMHLCFENLMEGIERNLLTKNRDRWVTSETLQPHLILIQFWFDSQILLHLMNDLYGNSHSVLWLE